jgi:hypothetical protein
MHAHIVAFFCSLSGEEDLKRFSEGRLRSISAAKDQQLKQFQAAFVVGIGSGFDSFDSHEIES